MAGGAAARDVGDGASGTDALKLNRRVTGDEAQAIHDLCQSVDHCGVMELGRVSTTVADEKLDLSRDLNGAPSRPLLASRDEGVQPLYAMDESFLQQEGQGAIHGRRRRLRMGRAQMLQQCIGPDGPVRCMQQIEHGTPQRCQDTPARPTPDPYGASGEVGCDNGGQRSWHRDML